MGCKLFIGIDPGKSGAVIVLDEDGEIVRRHETPTVGKEYDKQLMRAVLTNHDPDDKVYAYLEHVHTTQMGGKASNFDFGRGKGIWEGLLMGLNIRHSMVRAKEWQKEMWQGVKVQYKQGAKKKTIDTKATSLLAAKQLQPTIDWRKISDKTGNPLSAIDDGAVDAYLIAEYCRRKFK